MSSVLGGRWCLRMVCSDFTDTWSLAQHLLPVYHAKGKCQVCRSVPLCAGYGDKAPGLSSSSCFLVSKHEGETEPIPAVPHTFGLSCSHPALEAAVCLLSGSRARIPHLAHTWSFRSLGWEVGPSCNLVLPTFRVQSFRFLELAAA